MLKERLSPADEAARDNEMRDALAVCPRILDLIAQGPLVDPDAEAVVYLRSPLVVYFIMRRIGMFKSRRTP